MPLTKDEDDALYHLGYEWWMARATYSLLLDVGIVHDPVRNALVESMNIHIRGLISFFCDEPKRKDDWAIIHLSHGLQRVERPPYLCKLMRDINGRIAHLTARRLDLSGLIHEWQVDQALNFVGGKVTEVRTAFGTDFPKDWIGDAKSTTCLFRELSSETVTGASAPFSSGPIGATGPAPPSS